MITLVIADYSKIKTNNMQKFFTDILGSLMMVQDFYSEIHSPLLYLTQCFAFL